MFCSDGIYWSHPVILASLAPHLKESLSDDSCLILPDINLQEFSAFHANLFRKDVPTSPDQIGAGTSVASLFGITTLSSSRTFLPSSSPSSLNTINYEDIFRDHREDYIKRVVGNSDIAKQVMNTLQKSVRPPKVSDILGDILVTKSSGLIQCADCNRQFEDDEMLKTHREIVHSETSKALSKPFSCPYCSKQFSFKVNVERHVYLVHPQGETDAVGETEEEMGGGDDGDNRENSGISDETCDSGSRLGRGQFQCRICDKFLKSKRYLVAHMQEHYGGGYRCDWPGCSSVFRENAKLKRHRLVHTGEKAFKCEYCGLSFSLRHNLKTHEKTHTRTDLLKCRYCPYETIQKSNLKLHEATHERAAQEGGGGRGRGRGKGRPPGRLNRREVDTEDQGET